MPSAAAGREPEAGCYTTAVPSSVVFMGAEKIVICESSQQLKRVRALRERVKRVDGSVSVAAHGGDRR